MRIRVRVNAFPGLDADARVFVFHRSDTMISEGLIPLREQEGHTENPVGQWEKTSSTEDDPWFIDSDFAPE